MRPRQGRLEFLVQCYEHVGLNKGDDRLRGQCLPDLQLPDHQPNRDYRGVELAVVVVRA